MSEHKIEEYKGQKVKVWNRGGEKLDFELLGEMADGSVIVINEDGEMEKFDLWEPLPTVEPITILDLMKAGMFCRQTLGDAVRISPITDHLMSTVFVYFHLDPTAPLDQWKKFENLTWEDLK